MNSTKTDPLFVSIEDFVPQFYWLSIINILSNLIIPLVGLVDAALLGHLANIEDLAGVLLATILFEYIYQLFPCLRSATNAMTAQAVGEDDSEAIALTLYRNGIVALSIGVLIVVLQFPLQTVGFALLNPPPGVKDAAIAYFNTRIWGAPAVAINYVLIGWFFGQQKNSTNLFLSCVVNGINILLAYLCIVQLGWESAGAGIAAAISQYLALIIGLIIVLVEIPGKTLSSTIPQIWNWAAFKATFTFVGNLLIRYLAFFSTLLIFTNLSSALGVAILTQNGLLLKIIDTSIYIIQGFGYATSSFAGIFKGQGNYQLMKSLIRLSIGTSLLLSSILAFTLVCFPKFIFGLFTNNLEVVNDIQSYVIWLIPILGSLAVSFVLEGYFIGLIEGKLLRNTALIAFGLGFTPMAFVAWYTHSNHILWLSLWLYFVVIILVLSTQVSKTLKSSLDTNTNSK